MVLYIDYITDLYTCAPQLILVPVHSSYSVKMHQSDWLKGVPISIRIILL